MFFWKSTYFRNMEYVELPRLSYCITFDGFVRWRGGPLAKMHNLWALRCPRTEFHQTWMWGWPRYCSYTIVFPEILFVSTQRQSKYDGVWIFCSKNGRFEAQFFFLGGGQYVPLLPLMNNTTKTSFSEYLGKICPAIAEQSRQKKKNTERPLKHKTSPSLAASSAVQSEYNTI